MSSMELRVKESCSDRSEELEAGFVWRRENVRFKIVNFDGFERAVLNDRSLCGWTNV